MSIISASSTDGVVNHQQQFIGVKKKRHPQLLKLVPLRAQSCTDFGHRLTPPQQQPAAPTMLPSSLAAAALSAKQHRDMATRHQFVPFSPFASPTATTPQHVVASPKNNNSNNNSSSSENGNNGNKSELSGCHSAPLDGRSATFGGSSAAASPRSSKPVSRLCYSFRRTLRRRNNSPATVAKQHALDKTTSNVASSSTPPPTTTSAATARGGHSMSMVEQQQGGEGGLDINHSTKGSVDSLTFSSNEESHLLTNAWRQQSQRKESRILLPELLFKSLAAGGGTMEQQQRQQQQQMNATTADKPESSFSLRRLSKAFFQSQQQQPVDLMNDWEIGGTQNAWVCPSDRHLQLRAQLKSGWSVRTATARSPTTSKQALMNGISEAEQEQIQKVLARAEQGRMNEQKRINKMMERLERLKTRATGNGVTQCVLCQTEFGLLAAKSYAAMCSDCRKYVCQRNCGVETFDQKSRQPVFLCKICSEYREMWKKSGAWFYRELPLPLPSRPSSAMAGPSSSSIINSLSNIAGPTCMSAPIDHPTSPTATSRSLGGSHTGPMPRRQFDMLRQESRDSRTTTAAGGNSRHQQRGSEPIPPPSEQQQRLKTNPRPRIIPSWVHDGLQQSSVSVDDSDAASSASSSTSSSLEPAQFRKSLGATKERAMVVKQRAAQQQQQLQQQQIGGSRLVGGGPTAKGASSGRMGATKGYGAGQGQTATGMAQMMTAGGGGTYNQQQQMQRVQIGRKKGRRSGAGAAMVDSDSDEREEEQDDGLLLSRRSSLLSTNSPRRSLQTPSSLGGGDDLLAGVATTRFTTGQPNIRNDAGEEEEEEEAGGVDSSMTNKQQSTMAHQQQLQQQQQMMDNERHTMSDSRSVDSGVVQSDHSAQLQLQQQQQQQQQGLAALAGPGGWQQHTFNEGSGNAMAHYHAQQQQHFRSSPSPVPPPIPPRNVNVQAAPPKPLPPSLLQQIQQHQQQTVAGGGTTPFDGKRPSSASSALTNPLSMIVANTLQQQQQPQLRKSSLGRSSALSTRMREDEGGSERDAQQQQRHQQTLANAILATDHQQIQRILDSRRSTQSTVPPMDVCSKEDMFAILHAEDESSGNHKAVGIMANAADDDADSPTFMSSPEDDTSTLGSIQFNLTYLAEDKQLIIHLIGAKKLKAMDKNGFSDPYVKFHLLPGNTKATKLTSRTIEKTLNPEWNEEMIYYGITEEERLRKTLRVTVLDRDRIGSDFLGETRVALRKLPPGIMKKFNLYLEHAMPTPLDKADDKERGKLLLSVSYNIQQGSLFVGIKRCAELLGMDATGFSDPYCKVLLTPLASKAHRQRTSIKKRTLNPEFNETLQFLVPFKDLPKKTLEIGVYDYDVGRHDDYIGGIVLSTAAPGERGRQWQQVIENPGKTFEYWHKLEADD